MNIFEIINQAIVGKVFDKEGMTLYLAQDDFYFHGYTEESLYSDEGQDDIYNATVDLFSNERMPTIHIEFVEDCE